MKKPNFFDEASFSFFIDLYRVRLKAEIRQDKNALESLHQHYPELLWIKLKS